MTEDIEGNYRRFLMNFSYDPNDTFHLIRHNLFNKNIEQYLNEIIVISIKYYKMRYPNQIVTPRCKPK